VLSPTDYTIYTLSIFDRVTVMVRVRFNVQIKYSNSMIFKNSLSASWSKCRPLKVAACSATALPRTSLSASRHRMHVQCACLESSRQLDIESGRESRSTRLENRGNLQSAFFDFVVDGGYDDRWTPKHQRHSFVPSSAPESTAVMLLLPVFRRLSSISLI